MVIRSVSTGSAYIEGNARVRSSTRSTVSTASDGRSSAITGRRTTPAKIAAKTTAPSPSRPSQLQAYVRYPVAKYIVAPSAAPPPKVTTTDARYQRFTSERHGGRGRSSARAPSAAAAWRSRCRMADQVAPWNPKRMKYTSLLSVISTPRTPGRYCRHW